METHEREIPAPELIFDSESDAFYREFLTFLREFRLEQPVEPYHFDYYAQEAVQMKHNRRTTLYIDCHHMLQPQYLELFGTIIESFYRLEPVMCRAVKDYLQDIYPEFGRLNFFSIGFMNSQEVNGIREMKSEKLGKLVALKGTVTKSSEVRPELIHGQFSCSQCRTLTPPIPQQFAYTTPKFCPNPQCQNKMAFELVRERSRYSDWQKIRLQELDSDMPPGSMPRSIDVILRGEQVERAQPGDRAIIVGSLIVIPDAFSMVKPGEKFELNKGADAQRNPMMQGLEGATGLSSLGVRDLNYRMIFLANCVQVNQNKMSEDNSPLSVRQETLDSVLEAMSDADRKMIGEVSKETDLFTKLASLIAPSVYGNRDIKKGILLMLLGGVTKRTPEGIKLRGDLNLCIVGDPSTAKSQFLKFVHKFVPRTVYTSGKGSTAAGLTASISKDHESGDFTIEAGALILADNGICCIDEFDKMDEKDVVAIHEAMEQQTISLTKAGIQATLNARCSILAAANPIFGRYDKSKTLRANVKLTPPLMSRFDMFFVLTDECNEKVDAFLARHILAIHRNFQTDGMTVEQLLDRQVGKNGHASISQSDFLKYLKVARLVNPRITLEAAECLEKAYIQLRTNELSISRSSYRVTVRQLESLVRLSEAIAKVHLENEIRRSHVEAAFDLLSKSMVGIHQEDVNLLMDEEQGREAGARAAANPIESQLRQKKKKLVTLSADQFQTIAKVLTKIIREKPEDNPPTLSMLVNEFLVTELEKLANHEMLEASEKLVRSVIRHMIEKERVLLTFPNLDHPEDPFVKMHSQAVTALD